MIGKIKNTINKYDMLSASSDVTVALSGGADSVCLLYALYELRDEFGLTISAFHLNHCLRGAESDRDEGFVKELCQKLGIPLAVERRDIKAEAERRGESIELCARNIRYELYKKHANGLVAVAHTESDNLETVIYNMTRGSGIKGLGGIPPVRDIFIRPLIECTRREVEEYLRGKDICFVTDSSNLSDDYSRNYIRHNIVPALKRINPSAEQTVGANSEALREDADFLSGMATKIYSIIAKEDRLDAAMLKEQHPAIAKRILSMLYFEQSGKNADNLHINRMYEVLRDGGKASLPCGFSAESDGKRFRIYREGGKAEFRYETELVYEKAQKSYNVYNLLLKNRVDCDKIKGKLTVRIRNEGDSIRLAGRNCTKSLKKLFNELKIPTEEREALPVAADDEGVVWIHSVGVAERVKIDANTENIVCFNVNKSLFSGEVKND